MRSFYLTAQMSYGIRDFKANAIVEEVCKLFGLKKLKEEFPSIFIQNGEGRMLEMVVREI